MLNTLVYVIIRQNWDRNVFRLYCNLPDLQFRQLSYKIIWHNYFVM